MRIIQANKFFYPKGGADRIFLDTIALLEKAGHTVAPFAMRDEQNLPCKYARYFVSHVNFNHPKTVREKARAAGRMAYSFEARKKFAALVDHARPDVVHVHNIYHQISPSVLSVCAQRRIPVVMTAHDWFLINPNYTRYARGLMQTDIGVWKYVFDCGIQDSFLKTLFATVVWSAQNALGLWADRCDRIICPSEFMRAEFLRAGIPEKKLITLSNPVPDHSRISREAAGNAIVFFGRLEKQKGIYTFLAAAEQAPDITWIIIGDGTESKSLQQEIKQKQLRNVRMTGRLEGKKLADTVVSAAAVVVPSEWPENQPVVIIESQLWGVPVIASTLPSTKEMIRDKATGFLIPQQNPAALAEKARWILEHPREAERIGAAGKKFAEKKYDPKKYVEQLTKIYHEVIKEKQNAKP